MAKELSAAMERSEIIASYAYGTKADASSLAVGVGSDSPAPAAGDPNADAPEANPADSSVEDAIAKIKADIAAAQAAQSKDPDDSSDPNDAAVDDLLKQLEDIAEQLEAAQAKDTAEDDKTGSTPNPDAVPEEPGAPATTAAGAPAPADPTPTPDDPADGAPADSDDRVDDEGNVKSTVKCSNPDCGHLAGAHENLDTGDNSGPCGMKNCECAGFTLDTKQMQDPDANDGGGGPDNAGGDDTPDGGATSTKLAAGDDSPPVDAPAATPEATGDTSNLNAPPEIAGGDSMGPAFTIPVGVILNQDTGDGRKIAPDALDWRVPPMPLMGLGTSTHDPNGMDLNDPAVLCGRIDSLSIEAGEGDTQIVVAQGFYLPNDDGMHFAELNEAMGRLGISADIAADEMDVTGELDEDGWPTAVTETLTKGTIMGFTVCPFPAFEGAYIVLGDGSDQPAAIPQQTSEDSAATDAMPDAVAAGGQMIHWMTYAECEPCASGMDLIVASGSAPVAPPKAWFDNPHFTVGDGRLMELAETRRKNRVGKAYGCPLTVTDDGQVYGHIAAWGVCHTGVSGQCIVAPRSSTDYAHFKRGAVLTAEGETVRTGVLTANTGHASTARGVTPSSAMAHYDNTALQVADVTIGEDDFGIWVAGAVRPGATEDQIRTLRASAPSGDWRNMGRGLELVAALAVNQPGFPVAVTASGRVESLVAAGAQAMFRLAHPVEQESVVASGDGSAMEKALSPLLNLAKDSARNRVSAIR